MIVRLPEIDFIDDKAGKPVGIHKFIGKRPIAAFGNSDGDFEMLEWTSPPAIRSRGSACSSTTTTRRASSPTIGRVRSAGSTRGLDEAPDRAAGRSSA